MGWKIVQGFLGARIQYGVSRCRLNLECIKKPHSIMECGWGMAVRQ